MLQPGQGEEAVGRIAVLPAVDEALIDPYAAHPLALADGAREVDPSLVLDDHLERGATPVGAGRERELLHLVVAVHGAEHDAVAEVLHRARHGRAHRAVEDVQGVPQRHPVAHLNALWGQPR